MNNELIYLLRILISIVLGFFIGFERKLRMKEAGMRTHAIVSAGACIMMIVSKYAFDDLLSYDGSRVASQVVSGIGFLGAGMIMYRKQAIQNLTTAAGVWATAGIGMAVGGGLYYFAIGASIILIITQIVLHLPLKIYSTKKTYRYTVIFETDDINIEEINKIFDLNKIYLSTTVVQDGRLLTTARIRSNVYYNLLDVKSILSSHPYIKSIEYSNEE